MSRRVIQPQMPPLSPKAKERNQLETPPSQHYRKVAKVVSPVVASPVKKSQSSAASIVYAAATLATLGFLPAQIQQHNQTSGFCGEDTSAFSEVESSVTLRCKSEPKPQTKPAQISVTNPETKEEEMDVEDPSLLGEKEGDADLDVAIESEIKKLEKSEAGKEMTELVKTIGEATEQKGEQEQQDLVFHNLIKRRLYPLFISHLRQGGVTDDLINASDSSGWTALQYAVAQNEPSAIRSIFTYAKCADVNAVGKNGKTALHVAVEDISNAKDAKILNLLLDRQEININIKDAEGRTPLHCAVEKGTAFAFKRLLECPDSQPDLANAKGVTPLETAITKGRNTFIKPLIEAGADPMKRTSDGSFPLFYAIKVGDKTTIESLIDAVKTQNAAAAQKAAAAGAPPPEIDPINVTDSEGNTPLHAAAKMLRFPLINAFVQAGAKLDVKNAEGLTPFDVSVKYEQDQNVREFLKGARGASVT